MFWKKRKKATENEAITGIAQDIKAIALTDTGIVRQNNEDSVLFIRPNEKQKRSFKGFLGIVADGMGGHQGGAVASKLATDMISTAYYDSDLPPVEALGAAMRKANNTILNRASSNTELQNMGTTCTAVVLIDQQIILGHIGDSRAYLLQNDQLIQLTTDHTYVQELVNQGQISPMEAINHPKRNVLTQAMGTIADRFGDVSIHPIAFQETDRLLLCSDGLYDYFTIDELLDYLQMNNLRECGEQLITVACDRGGHDNITLLLIEKQQENLSTDNPTAIKQ